MSTRTYRTPEEIAVFRRQYPGHVVPMDAEAVQVTTGEDDPQIEVLRPNTANPGLVSPEGVNTTNDSDDATRPF